MLHAWLQENGGPLDNAHASEGLQEAQKIRRLQVMINMVMSVISQDPNLTVEEASELVAGTKRAALAIERARSSPQRGAFPRSARRDA